MRRAGFTLIELLVVMAILAVLAGLVVPMVFRGQEQASRVECIDHVRNLVGLLEGEDRYPGVGGPALVLYVVKKGMLTTRDELETLFCPGDGNEDLKKAGGPEAYRDLDLNRKGDLGGLTSYAGTDQARENCRARKGGPARVILADDSEDHHNAKGLVVGLTGGTAKWRDKVDDYDLARDHPLSVGESSEIEELRCLTSH